MATLIETLPTGKSRRAVIETASARAEAGEASRTRSAAAASRTHRADFVLMRLFLASGVLPTSLAVRAAGHSDAERRLAELGEVALEPPHHRTTDEAGGVERGLELRRAHRLIVLAGCCRWRSPPRLATSRARPPWP